MLPDKFTKIIALGLAQSEGASHNFLRRGIYDPRLLCNCIKLFYGKFGDCRKSYFDQHEISFAKISKYDFIDYDNVEMFKVKIKEIDPCGDTLLYVWRSMVDPFKPQCFSYILQNTAKREKFILRFKFEDIYDLTTEKDQLVYLKHKPFEIIHIIRKFGIVPGYAGSFGPIKDLKEFGLDHQEIILHPEIRPYFASHLPGLCRLASYNDEYFALERKLIDLFYEPDGKEFKDFQEEIKCPDNDEVLREGKTSNLGPSDWLDRPAVLEYLIKNMAFIKRSCESYLEIEREERIEYMKLVGTLINNFCRWHFRNTDRQLPMGEYVNTPFMFHSCLYQLAPEQIPKLFQLSIYGLTTSNQRYYAQNLKVPYANFYVHDNSLQENLEIQRLRQAGRTDLLFKFSREFCFHKPPAYLTINMLKCLIKEYRFYPSEYVNMIHRFIEYKNFELADFLIETFNIKFSDWIREFRIDSERSSAEHYKRVIQFLKKHFDGSRLVHYYSSETAEIINGIFKERSLRV